jgi:hypothetical protein
MKLDIASGLSPEINQRAGRRKPGADSGVDGQNNSSRRHRAARRISTHRKLNGALVGETIEGQMRLFPRQPRLCLALLGAPLWRGERPVLTYYASAATALYDQPSCRCRLDELPAIAWIVSRCLRAQTTRTVNNSNNVLVNLQASYRSGILGLRRPRPAGCLLRHSALASSS